MYSGVPMNVPTVVSCCGVPAGGLTRPKSKMRVTGGRSVEKMFSGFRSR